MSFSQLNSQMIYSNFGGAGEIHSSAGRLSTNNFGQMLHKSDFLPLTFLETRMLVIVESYKQCRDS